MKKMLVFQTDFTYAEGAVPSMLGVVKSVDLDIECITATHQIPQYDTWSASYRLYQYIDFWPKGTIFVSVVDPGVGTSRRACVAKTKNGYYIMYITNGVLKKLEKLMKQRTVYTVMTMVMCLSSMVVIYLDIVPQN